MKTNVFNIYIAFGTLPSLFSKINIFINNNPSIIFVKNYTEFINEKNYPDNLVEYNIIKSKTDKEFIDKEIYEIRNKLSELYKTNKEMNFHIYCDDSRIQFILKLYSDNELAKRIKKIFIVSEGNITEYMARIVNENYFYDKKEKWSNMIKKVENNVNSEELNQEMSTIDNYGYMLSKKENVEYLIPNLKELINNTQLNKYSNLNLKSINFYKMFQMLPNKLKKDFLESSLIESSILSKLENSKKALIINGTYMFFNQEIMSFIYSDLISKVVDDYGRDFQLYYKAHPLFPASDNPTLRDFLNSNNIIILPEKFPIELLLWNNKKILIGGFCSSIHSLVRKKQVKFIFGDLNGFSKYIYNKKKHDFFYNLSLSQDMAALTLGYDLSRDIINLNYNVHNINIKMEELYKKIEKIEKSKEK